MDFGHRVKILVIWHVIIKQDMIHIVIILLILIKLCLVSIKLIKWINIGHKLGLV